MQAGIGIGLDAPVVLAVEGATEVEVAIEQVGSADIHGLVGIDTGSGCIFYRLCHVAMVVGEVCAEVEGLLMAMAVVVVVIGSDLGCGVVLEVRIALSYDKRLAVVTPTEAVEQLDASLVKTGTGSQVVRSLVSQQTVTCIGIQEECVLCGECVQCPALIVKLFVMDRDNQAV